MAIMLPTLYSNNNYINLSTRSINPNEIHLTQWYLMNIFKMFYFCIYEINRFIFNKSLGYFLDSWKKNICHPDLFDK